jgi:Glycosyl transferase family 2
MALAADARDQRVVRVDRRERRAVKVAALMIVRDEADLLGVNLAHHRALGIDEFWIIDNGSTDATTDILRKAAADHDSIRWQRDDGLFAQPEMTTALARDAQRAGADWVVAIDADEFWVTDGRPLHEILGATDLGIGSLAAEVVNYVQGRWVTSAGPGSLLTMTRRAPASVGTNVEAQWLVENRHAAYVETAYPPKLVSRATDAISISAGNHMVDGVDGAVEATDAIVCLHAPLRARDRITVKGLHADRMPSDSFPSGDGWQPRRWRALPPERIEAEWWANSYDDIDLDVFGHLHPLIVDTRLRDAVVPHMSWPTRVRASIEFRVYAQRRRRDLRRDARTAARADGRTREGGAT